LSHKEAFYHCWSFC